MTDRRPVGQPTLAELLRQAKGTMTMPEFEACMPIDPATGLHTPGEDNLSRMMNQPLKAFPKDATILNLAAGTGFHPEDIIDACCHSRNIPLRRRRSRLEIRLPRSGYLDKLSDDEIEDIVALVQIRIQAHEAMDRARTAALEQHPEGTDVPAQTSRSRRRAPARR